MKTFFLSSDIEEVIKHVSGSAIDLSGKNVLLTGGRGFLGRYFVEIFDRLNKDILDKPVTLTVLDNLITAGKERLQIFQNMINIKFIKHDVIHPFTCDEPLDYIIHAAGIASPYYYRAYPIETLEVAISGTRNMLTLATRI